MNNKPKDWHIVNNKLHRQFIFNDFAQAFAFMTRVAILAEVQNHHPYWQNSYKTLDIYLSTHEANDSITQKDIKLANSINDINNNDL